MQLEDALPSVEILDVHNMMPMDVVSGAKIDISSITLEDAFQSILSAKPMTTQEHAPVAIKEEW